MIGLDLADVCLDGCITKAPCGGQCAGRSPVDRGERGLKRSQLIDGDGVPLAAVSAPANIRDHALLPPRWMSSRTGSHCPSAQRSTWTLATTTSPAAPSSLNGG